LPKNLLVVAAATPTAYEIVLWRLWRAALQRRFVSGAIAPENKAMLQHRTPNAFI